MDRKFIYLCLAHMSGREQDFIKDAFDTNWVVPLGPNVNGFEGDLEAFLGEGKRVAALSSGTAAVHLALKAMGVGPGDEVMVQSFTFCASANPVVYLGGKPVFVDSEPGTWNMDPELLDEAIADRVQKTGHRPRAIVPVHLYGMPARMDDIMAVAWKWDIPVVEDAAEGLGSRYRGRACGTFGHYGALSFNGNKMITTSGGGALVCPDGDSKADAMYLATQACMAYPYYQHTDIGYNYRMSNICAGIGRGQMTVLAEHVSHHRRLHALYGSLLRGVEGVTLHEAPLPEMESNYWLSTLTLGERVRVRGEERAYTESVRGAVGGAAGVRRQGGSLHTGCEPRANVEALRLNLLQAGVESRPLWKPLHLQPVFAEAPRYGGKVSENLFLSGLCLPSGPMVSEDDVRYIVEKIKESILA